MIKILTIATCLASLSFGLELRFAPIGVSVLSINGGAFGERVAHWIIGNAI